MSIRKFNGDNGKWAPVLTHVDAVIGWDGKTLTQIIKALEEEIEESGSIEDGSHKEIWEMTPGKFYSKGNKIYLCTRGGNDDYTLPWEAVIIGPPDGIIVKVRHDGLVEGNIYEWTYINNETLQTVLGDYCTSEAVGNMFLQKGVTAITFNDSPIDHIGIVNIQRDTNPGQDDVYADIPYASTTVAGLMSAADKTKLNATSPVVTLTESQYNQMSTFDANTLYVVLEDPT